MDRRLKIITVALSMVYLFIIGEEIYLGMHDFILGFKKGVERVETDKTTFVSSGGTFYLSLKPENGFRTFPTTMSNLLDRKPMKAEIEKMVVEVNDVREKLPSGTITADVCSVLLTFLILFVLIMIPIQTFRVVHSITKNKIFDPSNIQKLRIIGYSLPVLYIANCLINFLHYRVAIHVVDFEGYVLQVNWGNTSLILLGLVVLMFAEVLKVSVKMKEEQDLTI